MDNPGLPEPNADLSEATIALQVPMGNTSGVLRCFRKSCASLLFLFYHSVLGETGNQKLSYAGGGCISLSTVLHYSNRNDRQEDS